MLKQGWHPKRTIIYCAWDGEEPGLLGSTEWVEEHDDELRQHAVLYINSDSSSRGYLCISGSHTLETRRERRSSARSRIRKRIFPFGSALSCGVSAAREPPDDREELRDRADLRIGALGDGIGLCSVPRSCGSRSDQHGIRRRAGGGVYHSIYDDFYWYTHFGDPEFVYERALAQMAGTTVMRIADADLLPFDPSASADTVKRYVGELKTELRASRTKRASVIARSKKACLPPPPIRRSNMCRRRSRQCHRS